MVGHWLGVQFRRVTCKGAQTNEVVSNLLCNGIRKPTEHSRQCNTECPTRLVIWLVCTLYDFYVTLLRLSAAGLFELSLVVRFLVVEEYLQGSSSVYK